MKDHPIARPTCGDATTPGIADNAPSEIGDQERERILARWTRIAVRLLQASHAELRAGEQGVDALAPRPACTNEPANRHEALACLGIPLPAAEGVPRGQLVVYDRAGRVWTAADVAVLCEVASALADALGVIAEKRRCSSLEAKLRDQVEMYRALIEASAEIVWVTNPDGVATEPSSSWQRYTGQSAEDWLGFGWMQVVHPEDQDRLRGFWVTAAAEGRPQSIEYRLRHNSGHWRWIHERTAPLVEPTGKLKGWVGMSFDIDDRRKAEEATRKSEAHQRALVEAMSVMTWSAGADNVLMDGTADKWCEFTGQTLADWHARQWLEVVHPDDRAAVSRRWFEQATSSQSTEYEYRLWHRSGEWRWVLERTVPLLDDRQGTCAGWVGMTTDITDYKRAELSVQESESRFRALVEASSNIVWTVDADGKFLEDSPSWRAFTGCSEEAWRNDDWINDVHPDDARAAAADWQSTLREGVANVFEYRLRNRSGGWSYMFERMVPLRNADGSLRGWVGMSSDITDRKHAELSLQESESRFRALVEASSQVCGATDANGAFLEDSPSWRAFTGCSKEAWLNGEWVKDVHPDDSRAVMEKWQRALQGGVATDYEYRLWNVVAGWRHMAERAVPLRHADGSIRGWVSMASDVTEQKLAANALEKSERLLQKAMEAAAMVAWTWEVESDEVSLSDHGCKLFELDKADGTMSDLLGCMAAADAVTFRSAVDRSAKTRQSFELVLELTERHGAQRWISASGQAELKADVQSTGAAVRANGVFRDITAGKTAEERRNLLVGEIAHRGKNLLAVVQSMAGITLNDSRPAAESRRVFLERLASLGRSHSMLTQQDWEGVPFDEIVRLELASYSDRAEIDVDSVLLNPSSAQNVALVTHELVTNAAKHGALSGPSGRVLVRGELHDALDGSVLRFNWQELDGPLVKPPARTGFGSMLLRRLVQGFDTEGVIEYRPEGLFIQVDMPLAMLTPNHVRLSEAVRRAGDPYPKLAHTM